MARLISRDPFAREELWRTSVGHVFDFGKCHWCSTGPARYTYEIRSDSINGRTATIKGVFCSISCMRSYHS